MDTQQDGNAYATMGGVLASTGTFTMPWGDGLGDGTTPGPSHHYPPLYPAYLAAYYHFLGWTPAVTKIANLNLSLLTLAAVFLMTRSLYGKDKALWVTGLVAVIPRFVMATGTGFSENLVVLVFAGTIWAGIKSLDKPAYLLAAGTFAGLSFLTRSGMGPFFFVGILAGFLWRLKHRGAKGTFLNGGYVAGGFAFLALLAPWSWRNWHAFGSWQSSSYLDWVTHTSIQYPGYLAAGVLFKFAQYALVLALFYKVFQTEWAKAWKEKAGETTSLLWLTVGLVFILGFVISGMIWSVERSPPFWMDSERYLAAAYVPLLWLLIPRAKTEGKDFKARYVALACIFILAGAYEVVEPTRSPEVAAAQALPIHAGQSIGVVDQEQGLGRYSFYPDLPTHDHIGLVLCDTNTTDPCHGQAPDFILGITENTDPAYHLIGQHRTDFLLFGHSKTVYTYQRT